MNNSMTIEEAREILGTDADSMTDTQIEELIDHLSVMARWALKDSARRLAIGRQSLDLSKTDTTEV